MNTKILIAAAVLLGLGAADHLSANLIIAIDQTGANNPVNVNSPRAWNFGVTAAGASYFAANGVTFDSALFDAKIHNNTVAPLVFTLYSGLGGNVNGNSVLTTLSVPSSQFNQQYAGGLGKLFTFQPQSFTEGYYSVTLTSVAEDKATTEYFLKQGKLALLNSDKTVLDSSYWVQDQGNGNATSAFNGSENLNGGGIAMAPEVNTSWAIALLIGLSFGGALLRRTQYQRLFARAS
jgi:hypothetical protein